MTEHNVALTEAERDLLERVRLNQGLNNIEQAAEWLAKSTLRKAAQRTSGRGRALYPIQSQHREPK